MDALVEGGRRNDERLVLTDRVRRGVIKGASNVVLARRSLVAATRDAEFWRCYAFDGDGGFDFEATGERLVRRLNGVERETTEGGRTTISPRSRRCCPAAAPAGGSDST